MSQQFFRKVKSCLLLWNIRFLYMLPFFTRKVRRCPVCGASCQELEFVNRHTPLDRCTTCGHVYSRKVPKKRILLLIYKGLRYWEEDKHHQGITKIEYGPHWKEFLDVRMGIVEKTGVVSGDRKLKVFEIGCSEGILLRELENRGHTAAGCEMNVATAEAGTRELGVSIDADLFENLILEDYCYDVVLSFHTIEHVADLDRVFEKISQMLKNDGSLLIEVPCRSEEYTNTDHLQFFCEESLKTILGRFFDEAEIIPNAYTNVRGVEIGSLYGIGRRPRRPLRAS